MGDRCFVTVEFRSKDFENICETLKDRLWFDKLFNHNGNELSQMPTNDMKIQAEIKGANYGWIKQLELLAEKNIMVIVKNEQGDSYPAGITVTCNNRAWGVDMLDGNFIMPYRYKDGKILIHKNDKKAAVAFFEVYENVEKYLETGRIE